jgi:predicted aspartyl protease
VVSLKVFILAWKRFFGICKGLAKMWKKFVVSFFFLTMVFFLPLELRSEFYKYVDKRGIAHFVDTISKVPMEYRKDLESRKYKKNDPLSENKRNALLDNEKRNRNAMIQSFLSKEIETNVMIINNKVLVPVRLGYRGREIRTLLLLDTGASITLLHQNPIRQLGIKKQKSAQAQVADGSFINTGIAELNYIIVGPFKKTHVEVAFVEHEVASGTHDGLLGMNFLRGFEYSIDFERNVIKWKKP